MKFNGKIFLSVAVAALIGFSGLTSAQDKHAFVGADKCGTCHKTEKQGKQLDIWKNSAHAKAFETLKNEKSQAIAKKQGLKKAAHESEECLVCHASGYNVDASLKQAKFKVEDGVQCETCHNAGEHYQAMKVMKDHDLSVKNGMREFKSDAEIEKYCKTCHNSKSPTFKGFEFAKFWNDVKHPIPAKK